MPKLTDILCFGLTLVIFFLSHRPLFACSCIERRSTTQEGWGAYAIPSDGQKNVPCNPLFILRSSRLWGWSIATASSSHTTEKYNSVIELRSGQTMVPLRQSTSFAENDTTSFFRAVQQLQPRSRYQLVLTLRSIDAPTKSRTKSLSFWTGSCKKVRSKKAPLAQLYSGKIFVGESSIDPGEGGKGSEERGVIGGTSSTTQKAIQRYRSRKMACRLHFRLSRTRIWTSKLLR